MLENAKAPRQIVLVGMESVGKTSLFSMLAKRGGKAINVQGSTDFMQKQMLTTGDILVDLPSICMIDSATQKSTFQALEKADHILAVVRGTHMVEELETLLQLLPQNGKALSILVTFEDKVAEQVKESIRLKAQNQEFPLEFLSLREKEAFSYSEFMDLIEAGCPLTSRRKKELSQMDLPSRAAQASTMPREKASVLLAILAVVLLFVSPIVLAYHLSGWVEGHVEERLIQPIEAMAAPWPLWLEVLIAGDYGLLTLGVFSFVWAFPVVMFMATANAITEDSGLKDRLVNILDPGMRKIRLEGKDLVPFLTGFGCNVVALHQSRTCSSATRLGCVSLISFGSACSYQLGATLSIFHVAGMPWLFVPYLAVVTFIGAIHNRLWYPIKDERWASYFQKRRFYLQIPSYRVVAFRVKSVLWQFMTQALPIFLSICIVASLLHVAGVMNKASALIAPLMYLLGAPGEAASGLVFSLIRKDGILLFNQGNGELLAQLSAGTIFLLVYLASTLSACLVTLLAIAKEFKHRVMLAMAGKQLVTSLASALVMLLLFHLFS
ncbi:nucleoside recognition domain-containing protein [Shouchella shacheensis]|uniref:nucleoside recognition domain-containing protein n=1 Tax=Shouchella shacheensis TaxID=1649580 RepID=UPI000A92452B|nr:nucleoside recognition domain-containing protein [Shouchella shacheensis]